MDVYIGDSFLVGPHKVVFRGLAARGEECYTTALGNTLVMPSGWAFAMAGVQLLNYKRPVQQRGLKINFVEPKNKPLGPYSANDQGQTKGYLDGKTGLEFL